MSTSGTTFEVRPAAKGLPAFLKFLIGLGVVAVVCIVAAWFFGAQWFGKWAARKMAVRNPAVLVLPKPLPDTALNNAPGTDESFDGYFFQVPWKDKPIVNNYGAGGTMCSFGMHTVTLYKLAPNMMTEGIKRNPQQQQNIDKLFAGDVPKTDYEFMRRILNVTPDSFNWTMDKMETVRDGLLLTLKSTAAPREGASGIFYVTTPEFQGFQYGVPEAKETGVSVDLYGKNALLKFTFRERGGAPAVISQRDINRIVQSVRTGQDMLNWNLP
jgi:hypothetical protein